MKIAIRVVFLPQNSLTLRRQNWRQTSVLSKCQFSQLVSFSRKMQKTRKTNQNNSTCGEPSTTSAAGAAVGEAVGVAAESVGGESLGAAGPAVGVATGSTSL